MRVCTQQHKKRRAPSKSGSADAFVDDGLSVSNVKKARASDRICETLDELNSHLQSSERGTNSNACEVCGKKTLWKCVKCNKYICGSNGRNWKDGCMVNFHNISFFGLTRSDNADVHKKKTSDWTPPTQTVISRNKRRIRSLCKDIDKEKNGAGNDNDSEDEDESWLDSLAREDGLLVCPLDVEEISLGEEWLSDPPVGIHSIDGHGVLFPIDGNSLVETLLVES